MASWRRGPTTSREARRYYRFASWSFTATTYLVASLCHIGWAAAFLWCMAVAVVCVLGRASWVVVSTLGGLDVRLAERRARRLEQSR